MKKYAFLSLLAVLALGACDDDDDPAGTGGTAQVRVVNATTATTGTNTYTSVSLFRGTSTQVVGGVAAGSSSGTVNASACSPTLTVPAGSQTLNFRATGQTTNAASVTHNFVAGKRYLVVLTGNNNAGLNATVVEETQENATSGNRRIRFFNASGTAGDIYATANTTTAPTGTPTAGGLAARGASSYTAVPTANTGFRIYNTNTTTTARQSLTLNTTNFPASGNAWVFFTEAGAFQVNACS